MVIPNITALIDPSVAFGRVLSGVTHLLGLGNSIRAVAGMLSIPEGTLRRTIINQERAPSQATIDRLYNNLRDRGFVIRTPGKNIVSYDPIVPGPAGVENSRPGFGDRAASIVYDLPPGDPRNATYKRGKITIGPIAVGFDESLATALDRAGLIPENVARIIWKS